MAGFEVIVRPAVFPDIRPAPPRSVAPASDPTQGLAVFNGSGGGFIALSESYSASWSKSKPKEIEREYSEQRIYQVDEDGTINPSNFIDIEVATKFWMKDADDDVSTGSEPAEQPSTGSGDEEWEFAVPNEADNIETLSTGNRRANSQI
jgi:hypothetical protein